MEQALCLGPSCARCLKVCPGDAVGHWSRDWEACDPHRSPHGFAAALRPRRRASSRSPTPSAQKELVRSEDSFNLWQSILRGAGVITGCRQCADVCPVGADYQAMLSDALDAIPETHAGEGSARRADGAGRERAGRMPRDLRGAAALDRQRCAQRSVTCMLALPKSRAEIDAHPDARASGARSSRPGARRSTPASSTTSISTGSTTPDEWRKIPILNKDMLRALSDDAISTSKFCVKPDDGIAEFWRSGGATGAPLFYPRSFEDIRYAMAGFSRIYQCAGCPRGGRAHVSFPLGIHPGRPDAGALRHRCRHRGELGRLRHHHAVGDADRADRPAQADDLDGHEQLRPASRQPGRGARARSRGQLGEDRSSARPSRCPTPSAPSSRASGARRCATPSA